MSKGLTSKAKGGFARAEKLSPRKRKEIAKKAAETRWQLPKATHVGEIHLGNSRPLPCAVLADGRRVLSERGVGRALGKGFGGNDFRTEDGAGKLPFFIVAKNLKPYIPEDLMKLATQPIIYREPGRGGPPAHGIEATALPKVCDVWLKARDAGVLTKTQEPIAAKAELLMRGLAHTGIIALVDEATGYQEIRDKKALEEILNRYIDAELAKWAPRFSNEFYKQMCRLKGLHFNPNSSRRPYILAHITLDVVYDRIGPGLTEELKRKKKAEIANGGKDHRLHQWLTEEIGVPALDHHLTGVTFLGKSFADGDWEGFHRALDRVVPAYNRTLMFDFPEEPVAASTSSVLPSVQSLNAS